jgi:hypothetical protein
VMRKAYRSERRFSCATITSIIQYIIHEMLSKLGLLLHTDFNTQAYCCSDQIYCERSKPLSSFCRYLGLFFYMSFDRTVCTTIYSMYTCSSFWRRLIIAITYFKCNPFKIEMLLE